MKKILELIFAICAMMAISSCTYDYHFPDYTGARSKYTVTDLSSEVRQQLLPIAMESGVTLQYSSEKWRTLVTEKDAAGNILYQGEPRDRTDSKTKVLMVSYICSCRLQSFDWKYYDICRFDFEKQYPIEITPIPISVAISPSDKYTVTKYPVYIYNIDRNLPVIEKVNSYGYTFADAIMTITEKDENGDVIQSFEHRTIDGEIVTDTAKTIDVEIALYGYTPDYEKVYVGSYIFKEITLVDIDDTTLTLTEDMKHEFVENSNRPYSYNIDENLAIKKVNSYGYTFADAIMTITEKDENGNVIRSFEHRTIDGMIYTTAKTIDVEIALYGMTHDYYRVYVGSYFFKDINLENINNTTLILTEDMEHEFVGNVDITYSYNIDRSLLPTIEKIYSYGYTVADVNMAITEKDENGNVIRSFEHRTIDGMIYTTAKTIDVEIALYGYTPDYEKVYVGSYIFRNISLEEINGTTLTLTEGMEHEFAKDPDL